MRNLVLLLSFLLATNSIVAQRTVSIVDATDETPIEGALCQFGAQRFGVSDSEGIVKIPAGTDTLYLSHLTYVDTVLYRQVGGEMPELIRLRLNAYSLPVFAVSSQKKPRQYSPLDIVKQAIASKSDNYPTAREESHAFYRETYLRREDTPAVFNEAILGLTLDAYDARFKHRAAWSEGWRRNPPYRYQLPGGQRYVRGVHYPEGTQTYPAVDDAYTLYAARYCTAADQQDYPWFSAGPLALLSLDKLRLGYDFLDPSLLRKYNYRLIDTVVVANELCYRIDFAPSDDTPTEYHGLHRVHKTGVFRGSLYVTLADFALVRYTATNDKFIVPNYGSATRGQLPPGSTAVEVEYRKHPDDRWRISRVTSSVMHPSESDWRAERTLDIYPNRLNFETPIAEWVKFDYNTTLQSFTGVYSQTIWESFIRTPFYPHADRIPPTDCFRSTMDTPQIAVPASPTNPAAVPYLQEENAYYDNYFQRHPDLTRRVAGRLSDAAQGYRSNLTDADPSSIDSLLLTRYRPPSGFLVTDVEVVREKAWTLVVSENKEYNRRLDLYGAAGRITEMEWIDEYRWINDTLYTGIHNDVLRTETLRRWVAEEGWTDIMRENDPTYEYAFDRAPNGETLLLAESLGNVETYRLLGGRWIIDLPRSAGHSSVGRGYRCGIDLPTGYVEDCRETAEGSLVIVSDSTRHYLLVRPDSTKDWKRVALPNPYYLARFSDDTGLRVELEGTGTYGHHFRIDLLTGALTTDRIDESAINLTGYRDSVVWASSKDGTRIPCSLRWRADRPEAIRGTVLRVYAAYGSPFLIGYRPDDIALMELGFAVAYVHARGGGVLGADWYDAGREARKITACQDFLAAATYFHHAPPLAGSNRLFGIAQSAGGPILGYAVNGAPELFAGAIFDHAFLDVAGTMQQPDLPLTVYEYPEWGDPRQPEIRAAQLSYSPLQNIRRQAYPGLLFLAGYYDKSVPFSQVAAFVAELRRQNTGEQPILFHTGLNSSHPGTAFGPGQSLLVEQLAFLSALTE